jgi:4-aminobutyrate aminotransferase-like enzyme
MKSFLPLPTGWRFIPPVIITPEEIDRLVANLDEIFSTWS